MQTSSGKNAFSAACRPLAGDERTSAIAFLKGEGYSRQIASDDQFFVAELAGEIVGVVRLAREEGLLVLRGMRIRSDVRRRGVGSSLLRCLVGAIPAGEFCYCIPYCWLTAFYGQAGFRELSSSEAPRFLAARCAQYAGEGIDVMIMRRDPQAAAAN